MPEHSVHPLLESLSSPAPSKGQVIILGGPNGSGKTTCAKHLLYDFLKVHTYINADQITLEIFGYYPEENMVRPGKIMLRRIWKHADNSENFAFETTLAPKYFAYWLKGLTKERYDFILHYVWLQSPDLAVERVNARVKLGGHCVPEEVIRRRYRAGIRNFFSLYRPLAATWKVYDNSGLNPPRCIAFGQFDSQISIIEPELWEKFRRGRDEEL